MEAEEEEEEEIRKEAEELAKQETSHILALASESVWEGREGRREGETTHGRSTSM